MEMTKLKSIDDIARLAGVSKSTVSRALNDSSLVGAETKEKILSIAKEHSFRPSAIARNLSMRTSRTVAYVNHAYNNEACCLTDAFSLEIMGGVAIGLHALHYDLLVVHVDPADTDWASQYLDSGRVDAFILMTSVKKRSHVDKLLEIGAPFVVWGMGTGGYCSVCGDDRKGGRMAAEHLVAQGRRRIAFLGGPRYEMEVKERYKGYSEALAKAELDPRAYVAYGDWEESLAARELGSLLEREPKLDAVFATSDFMAIAAMRKIEESGRRVPDDVAVIGYDDLSVASYVTPKLTTVSQHVSAAGQILARDLVAYLEKGIITNTCTPVDLIVRESA
jgi:DNA-binding LacI/PurR family transcriptional regulator